MKLKLEIEAKEALELCGIHKAFMDVVVKNIGFFPIEYSKAARVTNNFFNEFVNKIPMEEIEKIKQENKDEAIT